MVQRHRDVEDVVRGLGRLSRAEVLSGGTAYHAYICVVVCLDDG
jgi:hypothetical protein